MEKAASVLIAEEGKDSQVQEKPGEFGYSGMGEMRSGEKLIRKYLVRRYGHV